MINIPNIFVQEYNQLNESQKIKFSELLGWSGHKMTNNNITDSAYENIFKMIKSMGENPDTPIQPDLPVNHAWIKLNK